MYSFIVSSRSTHVDDLLLSSSAVEKGSALPGSSVDELEVQSITILAVSSSQQTLPTPPVECVPPWRVQGHLQYHTMYHRPLSSRIVHFDP
jgi:hypothetical protein